MRERREDREDEKERIGEERLRKGQIERGEEVLIVSLIKPWEA